MVGVAAETAIAGAAVSEEREGCSLAWAAAGVRVVAGKAFDTVLHPSTLHIPTYRQYPLK